MQRTILLSVGLILATGLAWYAWSQRPVEDNGEGYHIHAAFQVYKNNELQDYSAIEFQYVRPCTANDQDEPHSAEELQLEKAHLHQQIDDVVHVHSETATWRDLFLNIKVDLGTPVTGYVNGQAIENILDQPIQADDRALILVGDNTDIETKLDGLPTIEHIRDTEQLVETC